jgi:hypothetical protein
MALGFLGKIFGGGIEEVIGGIGDVVDNFHTSGEEKAAAMLEIEKLLQADRMKLQDSIQAELQAKERVIVAELQQGDNYTKRARPTVVYAGLGFIFFNYVIAPLFLPEQAALQLPVEFWAAWGGIVGTWSIGRSFEKKGVVNKTTSVVTGSKSLFD